MNGLEDSTENLNINNENTETKKPSNFSFNLAASEFVPSWLPPATNSGDQNSSQPSKSSPAPVVKEKRRIHYNV